MFVLFIIYFRINFDFVLVYYTDDGSLELGFETSGLFAYHGNVLILIRPCIDGKLFFSTCLFCDSLQNCPSLKANLFLLMIIAFVYRTIFCCLFQFTSKY